ncbi:2738_t:CDS:2, partial [Cetraspora pellucida]
NKIDASKSCISKKIKLDPEICDLTSENESFQNLLDFSKSNDDSEEDAYYIKEIDNSEKDFEYKFHYVDEFLIEIYNNIITLIKNELIEAYNYNVTFKDEKVTRTGTQLIDDQDFQQFQSEYHKLSARKDTDSEIETDMLEDDCLKTPKNKNQVPKISNLTVEETQIAKSVLKIRTANYYRLLSQSSSFRLFPNSYILTPFYNPLQMVPTFALSYLNLEPTLYTTRSSIPTIGEFLKSIDENKNTDDYYQSFLLKFE